MVREKTRGRQGGQFLQRADAISARVLQPDDICLQRMATPAGRKSPRRHQAIAGSVMTGPWPVAPTTGLFYWSDIVVALGCLRRNALCINDFSTCFGALEDATDIDADQTIRISQACSVAHQPAGFHKVTPGVYGGILWIAASRANW